MELSPVVGDAVVEAVAVVVLGVAVLEITVVIVLGVVVVVLDVVLVVVVGVVVGVEVWEVRQSNGYKKNCPGHKAGTAIVSTYILISAGGGSFHPSLHHCWW